MKKLCKPTLMVLLGTLLISGCDETLVDSKSEKNPHKKIIVPVEDESKKEAASQVGKKSNEVKITLREKRSGKLELYPTINCIGVTYSELPEELTGKEFVLDWRIKGESKWSKGPELLSNPLNKKLRASIFPLPAGKLIEVRVVEEETITALGEIQLRPDTPNFGDVLKTIHVSVKGDNKNAGTKEAPYKTIRKALIKARAGTEIVIHGGEYNEILTPLRSGKEGAYITLRGATGEKVVISGALKLDSQKDWKLEKGIYYAKAEDALNATVGDKRIYSYPSYKTFLDQFDPKHKNYFMIRDQAKLEKVYTDITYSMAYDTKKKRMAFRVPQGIKPWDANIAIAQTESGLTFERNLFYRVTNITFSTFNKAGIHLTNKSSNIVIDNCTFSEIGSNGILVDRLSFDNLIENNHFIEKESSEWIWGLRKATVHESFGVGGWKAGPGNVMRKNRTDGPFNGIAMSSSMGGKSDTILSNTDIYDNMFIRHKDDAIEPEGAGVNNRVFNNIVQDSFVAISLAPINIGPTYVVRNTFEARNVCFKLQNHISPGAVRIYNNTCVSAKGDGVVNHNRRGGYVDNFVFRNNIINSGRYIISGFKGNDYDHNIFHTSDKGRFVKTGGSPKVRAKNLKELEEASGKKLDITQARIEFEQKDDGTLIPKSNTDKVYDKGVYLRGFTEGFLGKAPDMGSIEIQ